MSTSVADKEPPASPGNPNGEGLASPMPPMPPPPFNTPCGTADENVSMAAQPGQQGGRGVVSSSTLANKLAGLSVDDAPTTQAGGEETAGEGGNAAHIDDDDEEDEDEEDDGDEENDEDDDDDDEDGDGDEVDLPPEVMKRLYQLKALQSEKDIVYAQYKEERAALENKFAKLYGNIYAQRAVIVSGRGEAGGSGAESTRSARAEDDKERGVPHFWMQCMLHHEALRDVVCEGDLEALYYLSDVRCLDKENLLGFTLEFYFDENPFFANGVLTKRYDTANIMDQGEPLLEGVEGTKIEWKSGRNLCERIVRRRAKRGGRGGNRGGAEARMVTKVEKTDSFFKFFLNPVMYDQDEEEEDDDEEQYNFSFDMDYEIARIFRNHLIPNAVLWFTGEAVSEDEDDDEDEEDEEDEEGLEDTDGLSDDEAGVRGVGDGNGKAPAVKALNFQAKTARKPVSVSVSVSC